MHILKSGDGHLKFVTIVNNLFVSVSSANECDPDCCSVSFTNYLCSSFNF